MFEWLDSTKAGLIGGALSVPLLILLQPLIKKVWLKWFSLKSKDYSRNLSEAENIWLKRSAFRLSSEKSNKKYPRWTLLLTGGFLPVCIGMGLTVGVFFLALKLFIPDIAPEALSWQRMDFGGSTLLALLLGILLAAIAMVLAVRHSSITRDYLTYHYGWGYASPRPRGEVEISEELEHQLRLGKLTSASEFNSEEFSNLIFHRTTPAWKKGTLIIGLITLFFFILDTRSFYTLYPDRIEGSPYFSLQSKSYAFSDVVNTRRKCILAVEKKRPYSRFEFILEMKDGKTFNLLSDYGPSEDVQLASIEAIWDEIDLNAHRQTSVKSAPILNLSPTLENCKGLISNTYSNAQSDLIIKLFDL